MKNILDYNPKTHIVIKGAHLHNLKHIDLAIPRNQMSVITGLSGSGKSSLAFDTLYAEGQRRYVESLSSYARQFMGRLNKPKVDFIKGLSPAICGRTKGEHLQSTLYRGHQDRNLRLSKTTLCTYR